MRIEAKLSVLGLAAGAVLLLAGCASETSDEKFADAVFQTANDPGASAKTQSPYKDTVEEDAH